MPNYSASIVSNALQVSREKKTPYVAIQVQLLENLETGEPLNVTRTMVASLWLTENAKVRTVETLKAIGFTGASFLDLNQPVLVGLEVEVSTDFEIYNGENVERVAFLNAPGSFASRGVKPCSGDDAMKIAASFDALLRASNAQSNASGATCQAPRPAARPAAAAAPARRAPAPAANPQAAADVQGADDDLPF